MTAAPDALLPARAPSGKTTRFLPLWALIACLLPREATRAAEGRIDPPGFRPRSLEVHALTHARVVSKPGVELFPATLVVSNGVIVSVSTHVATNDVVAAQVPPGARIWNCQGLTLYPGFVDAYVPVRGETAPLAAAAFGGLESVDTRSGSFPAATASDVSADRRFFGVGGSEGDSGAPGPGSPNREVTPERRLAATYSPDAKLNEDLRNLGFAAAQMVPGRGILRGQAAVVLLGDQSPNASILKADSALCIGFSGTASAAPRDRYPDSLMGVIALFRQTFLDAAYHAEDQAHFERYPEGRSRPRLDLSLDALQAARQGQWVVFETGSPLMTDRAARLAPELGIRRKAFVGSGQEWRRPDQMAAADGPFILPLAFPALPKFPEESAWDDVSLDALRAWDWAPENPARLRQANLEIALTTHGLSDRKEFRANLRKAIDRGLSETDALAGLTLVPARLCGLDSVLGTLEPGRIANITVVEGSYFDPSAAVRGVWVEGVPHYPPVSANPSEKTTTTEPKRTNVVTEVRVANHPLRERGPLRIPPRVLIRNATIWTCGPEGVLPGANLLVEDGKVRSVGVFDASLPSDIHVMDGSGLHVTPGIIDAHSHSMILGNVNEATLPSTAMVRIADVVNSESPNIHLQLAGGVTTVNLLHGSANPIGGQNCVIKLREGGGPDALKIKDAPAGIKFALGENVKQANWGDRFTTRFPQSRMGVPTFFANRFEAARQYAAARQRAREPVAPGVPKPPPVRRDLELEALVEILDGSRLIHCHSYRQDEILAFLRTMESFGVRVATLQHILEGYKVADEIARHGAGASAFSDWWAFKYEVIDAIPYAGSLLHQRGVLVSFNSDSSDHARRLNLEAAKAVKYGGTPEVEALKFVTLNPARQLRLDHRIGSLEPGKDADFVVWSGHPLDTRSACLQTWIEGKQYFDRDREPERVRLLEEERHRLLTKARGSAKSGVDKDAPAKARERFFFRALEQSRHLGVVDCADCQITQRIAP